MNELSYNNTNRFNAAFEQHKQERAQRQVLDEQTTLEQLNNIENIKSIKDYNLLDILIGLKNTWFNIMDDLLEYKFELSTFTKGNRLFFIGLTFIFFAVILYLYNFFIHDDENDNNNDNKTQKVIRIEKYYINNKNDKLSDNQKYIVLN
jgi:hypothetical protein